MGLKRVMKTMAKGKFGRAITVLLWFAALGVLTEDIVLLRENRRLSEPAAPQIAAGTQLRMLAALNLEDHLEPISLPSAGSKILIITFSPGCPACQANQERWMKLASTLVQQGIRVLWVSRDPSDITRDYCLKHGIALADTLSDPPYRTYLQLGLARVPNTVLVGAGGTVEKVWAGRLDQAGWDSVFAYFGGRQETTSAARGVVDAVTAGCGPGSSNASAKNCK